MKKYLSVSAFIIFIALGLTLGTLYDLVLDKAVYNPASLFAAKMEAVGFWPLYLPTALMLAVLAKGERLIQKITGICLCSVAMLTLLVISLRYAIKREAPIWLVLIPFAACCAALLLIIRIKDVGTLKRLWFIGSCGFIYMILNNVVINILKSLWQRPRYDDMLAANSLEAFRPWYSLLGPGGSSFPSGHTGAACGVFVLLSLCSLYKFWQKKRGLMLALCWAYVGLMAAGRIIIGRHFLSDTVAAAAIGFIIFYLISKTTAYSKGLAFALSEDKG